MTRVLSTGPVFASRSSDPRRIDAGGSVSDRLLTAAAVADLLGVKPDTVLRYFETGRLPGLRLGGTKGGRVRFREAEVLAKLDEWSSVAAVR